MRGIFLRITAFVLFATLSGGCKKSGIKNDTPTEEAVALPATLPLIAHGTPLKQANYNLVVSTLDISLDGLSTVAMPSSDRWSLGVDVQSKKNGPADLYIAPLGAALEHAHPDASSNADARIVMDGTISYRIVTEVFFTLGQNKVTTFHLVAPSESGPREIDIAPPRASKFTGHERPGTFGPTVLLTSEGITVKTGSGENLAAGCAGPGAGVTLPKDAAGDMFNALETCLKKLHEPKDLEVVDRITITATPETMYRDVLRTTDTAVGAGFTNPVFGVPR